MTSGCFLVEAAFFFFPLPFPGRHFVFAARWPCSLARSGCALAPSSPCPRPPASTAQLLLSCSRPARPCHCKVVLLPWLLGPSSATTCHLLQGWWPCPGAPSRALCQDGLLAPPGFLVGVTPLLVLPLTRGAPGPVPAAVLHPHLQGVGCSHLCPLLKHERGRSLALKAWLMFWMGGEGGELPSLEGSPHLGYSAGSIACCAPVPGPGTGHGGSLPCVVWGYNSEGAGLV